MLLSFTACRNSSTDHITTTEQTTAAKELPAGIEECDYSNEPFNIIAPEWGLYTQFFFSDEEQSDAMDKAIYARDLLAEEHIRIDITYEYYGKIESILAEMPRLVMSGDDTCQLALTHCIGCVNALITEEYLYDFNDLEYVNLGAEWWNRSIIKNLAVKVRFFC